MLKPLYLLVVIILVVDGIPLSFCFKGRCYCLYIHWHINSMDEKIQFTIEDSREDGFMAFLDTLVIPCSDGSLSTKVYRKPTHTDLYLQWDSHHTIAAKYSVVSTLHHRAKAVCSTKQLLDEEEHHLQRS